MLILDFYPSFVYVQLTDVGEFVEGLVELLDVLVGGAVDAVEAELVDADVAVTCVMLN